MGDFSRGRATPPPFPKPQWPPIQDLDSLDICGKRKDGGLDLAIIASQPLDDAQETLTSIRRKVDTYLTAIGQREFQAEMGFPPREQTTIILICEHPIHPTATAVIEECKVKARSVGIRLEVRRSSMT